MRVPAVVLLVPCFGIAAWAATDPGYNCRPGQTCWPSPQEWSQFNESIGGHLYETIPIAAPCYNSSPYYNEVTCKEVQAYYAESIPRGDHFGQTYWLNWESCRNDGCALLESNPMETLYGSCSLAGLASYYVDVHNTSDISLTLRFAKMHNIRISIKNTGHDYYGRSSVPNTLAIWTHNLDNLKFYANFTANNCSAANGQNVGELEAGVVAGDAYRFFNQLNMDITGGYEPSVGIAGGFAQGGGIGSFTTTYGLMADNAVEFEVVTADGEIRIINQCNDPELFWAMRGGGGGTFAVLTKYRVQVYPSLPFHVFNFAASFAGEQASDVMNNTALREILTAHATYQTQWSAQLVTGQLEYFPDRVSLNLVLPYGDDGSKLKAATASFSQFLGYRTDLSISSHGYTSFPNYAAYLSVSASDAKATEPPGIFSMLTSRLIPREVFASSDTIDDLVEGVMQGIAGGRSLFNLTGVQIVPETPVTNLDMTESSSAHPAWRHALWHVIQVGEWLEPLDHEVLRRKAEGFLGLVDPLKRLSPGGGAYVNEAHYLEPHWQQTYFGSFYDRLLEVKDRYDPTHIFDCYKCVGWRGMEE